MHQLWAIVYGTNIKYTIGALLCWKFVCMWHCIAIWPQRKKQPASPGLYILQTPARRWKNTLYNMIWNIAKTCCINFILLSADVFVKLCSWFSFIIFTNRLNQYQTHLRDSEASTVWVMMTLRSCRFKLLFFQFEG